MSDSETFTPDVSSFRTTSTLVAGQGLEDFPAAWLTPAPDKYAIDRVYWNTAGPPEHHTRTAHYSVKWKKFSRSNLLSDTDGVEVAGILLRFYYGIRGCIIPLGFIPEVDIDAIAFTLAGPCDAEGKKDFYFLAHTPLLEDTVLRHFSPGFPSVADFHLNRPRLEATLIAPVACGAAAVLAEIAKFDLYW
ncbi:hypothetical protein B0H17DRAFT_1207667 [Mycena rosella]|uniref:Uncharacterized protein n=1 Tax=Mycena rosella TaxID=1033263 RepID=A0AAD7GAE0_MYCRO|nr:hypothetical protein B0H17DRAFT_1207667 [Mycena rosella]